MAGALERGLERPAPHAQPFSLHHMKDPSSNIVLLWNVNEGQKKDFCPVIVPELMKNL